MFNDFSHKKGIETKIEKVRVNYHGKEVAAYQLTVASQIPIGIGEAWEKVQTSALLEFVASGKVKFKPANRHFPKRWKEGDTVKTTMLLYGFLPFGGTHFLYFERIDNEGKILQTRERDFFCKNMGP